jgi:hypothetical protein
LTNGCANIYKCNSRTTLSIFVPVARAGLPKIKIAVAQQKLERKKPKTEFAHEIFKFSVASWATIGKFSGAEAKF